ncbi:MAG: SPOR domain-containing protein, partial [Gammaproteobacteria bacterium]|nr:SPOR domain-containing protein [Gammaproteobacteria bacterium]
MRRLLPPSIALALTLVALNAAAAGVVFGSFVNRGMADAQRDRVAAGLEVAVRVVAVDVNGERHYRVVAGEEGTETQARSMLARARAAGFSDAWYWPGVAPPRATPPIDPEPAPTAVAQTEPATVERPGPVDPDAEAQVAAEDVAPLDVEPPAVAAASGAGQMRLDVGDP